MSRLAIPRGALVLIKEVARHVLRRPVVGIVAVARTPDGHLLLVRRADVDAWALPGGTLEWGDTLSATIGRELEEEAGVDRCEILRLVGVFSRPDRDPRFHAVTIVVACEIDPPARGRGPRNPLEITDARLFAADQLPEVFAMGMKDMLEASLRGGEAVVE